MASFAKDAIKESLLQLLEEKPYSKITVKDIVDRCGINRNSFYYHFDDIPSLLNEIIQDWMDSVIDEYPVILSLEDCVDITIQTAEQRKKAVLHLYNSAGREALERYLWRLCDRAARRFLTTAFPEANISDADREILIRSLKCEVFGTTIEWLEGGMKMDLAAYHHRLFALRGGVLEEMIARAEADRK